MQIGNYRVIISFMAERKCVHPFKEKSSGGRATCPDTFFKGFFEKGKCDSCPKVTRGPVVIDYHSKGENDTYGVRLDAVEESSKMKNLRRGISS